MRSNWLQGKNCYLKILFWFFSCWILITSVQAHVVIDNKHYEEAGLFAKRLGLRARWIKMGEKMELAGGNTLIIFNGDKRDVTINGTKVWLGNITRVKGSALYINRKDIDNTLLPILNPQITKNNLQLFRIVIDPGHGKEDFGAESKELHIKEKDLALDVAKRLKVLLTQEGYQVDLTRSTDEFIEKRERAEIANQKKADLFLSIHFNAAGSPIAKGIETFALSNIGQLSTGDTKLQEEDLDTFPGNTQDSSNMLLAFCVQSALHRELQANDRGVKRARFKVLKWLNCPGILIEGGFITSPEESRLLADPLHRQNLAQAIALGIRKYHRTLEWIQTHPTS